MDEEDYQLMREISAALTLLAGAVDRLVEIIEDELEENETCTTTPSSD